MNEKNFFVSGVAPPMTDDEPALWLAFHGDKLLVYPEPPSVRVPALADFSDLGLRTVRSHYLGELAGARCYAVELAENTSPPKGMVFQGLRQVAALVDEDLFSLAGRALQILEWDKAHQFCGRCGTPLDESQTERAKECPVCGLLHFPRLSPAIIVLIHRNHELLLARSRHFPSGMYSVIAGFVEPGETLEQAVAREVHEEVGLVVKNIRYFGSQPWPFPHSLMIGFTAAYAGGEIVLNDDEIEEAGWYQIDRLPPLPSKISISRRLIDWFLAKEEKSRRMSGRKRQRE
jgi:NAD+ diphosphatase